MLDLLSLEKQTKEKDGFSLIIFLYNKSETTSLPLQNY